MAINFSEECQIKKTITIQLKSTTFEKLQKIREKLSEEFGLSISNAVLIELMINDSINNSSIEIEGKGLTFNELINDHSS